MLVAVTGFGRVWRHRFGRNVDDPRRFARGAYFNTTGVVVEGQLFEFLRLDYCASSRNAFSNRVLRLVEHGLLTRHELPFINREIVYSVSESGASDLTGKGEYHASSVEH